MLSVTNDLHSHIYIVHLPVFVVLWKSSDGRKWNEFFGAAATALRRLWLWLCRSALDVFFLASFDVTSSHAWSRLLSLIVISQPHTQQCASSVCLSSQSSSMCGALSALVLSSFLPPFDRCKLFATFERIWR